MKKLVVFLAIMTLAFTTTCEATPLKFKFAGHAPVNHQTTKHMQAMANEIKDRTEGRVEITVYPSSQLGDYSLNYEEMVRGTLDMELGGLPMELEPRLGIVYIWGWSADYEILREQLMPGTWLCNKLNELSSELGVRILGSYNEGLSGIASTKPLNDPLNPNVDKGVLTRIPIMDVCVEGSKAMGLRSITLPYPDIYQSLQTGVIDAAMGLTASVAYQSLGDVIKYWYTYNTHPEYIPIMISDKSWQKLTPEDQKVIEEVAGKYSKISIEQSQAEDEKYMKLLEKKGIKVFRYTKDDLKDHINACRAIWSKLGRTAGLTTELVEEFKKQLEK